MLVCCCYDCCCGYGCIYSIVYIVYVEMCVIMLKYIYICISIIYV